MKKTLVLLTIVAGMLLTGAVSVEGAVYYVSPFGSASWSQCTNSWSQCTNINTPCSLATALANADDDDIVYLRGGTYDVVYDHGVLEPDNSGSSGHPITFSAYAAETPIIDGANAGANPPGYLYYLSYITIDGLTFSNSGSNFNVITGGVGSSMQYGIILQNCTFNGKGVYSKSLNGLQILDNTFSNITFAGINISGHSTYRSTQTRIEGNTFTGTYSGTDVITLHESGGYPVGDYHIIKDNIINNSSGENCLD